VVWSGTSRVPSFTWTPDVLHNKKIITASLDQYYGQFDCQEYYKHLEDIEEF
jgi:hypothetical protein